MNEITKVSQITTDDIAAYLRLDSSDTDEENQLSTYFTAAKSYIMNYTGLTEEELDNYSDFVIVVFVLCQDMYDTRALYVDNTNITVNKVVETILDMHSVNLLPTADESES